MKKIIFALFVATLLTTPAFADNSGKGYVAADIGPAMFTSGTTLSNPNMAHIAGGYYFTPTIAAEIGYTKFSDATATLSSGVVTSSFSSFHAVGIYSYPLNTKFDLTGKLGASNNRSSTTATGTVVVVTPTTSKTSLMYGIGAQYHLSSKMDIRAQYDNYGDLVDNASTTLTTATLGVVYIF
jgi:OOP family OmpA-OmpF porin